MILAIDVGNTHTTLGLIDGDTAAHSWRLSTRMPRTADELAIWLKSLFDLDGVSAASIRGVVIGSVVRHLTPDLAAAARRLGLPRILVVDGRTPMPVVNGYSDPMAVGVDRLANAVGGARRDGLPLIVADLGSATTLDVISADNVYLGGIILPGVEMSADALFAGTSRLPRVPFEPTATVIGRDTRSSIQSGLFHGTAGALDTLIDRIRGELGAPDCRAVATGGLSACFAGHCRTISAFDPNLTLLGLADIWSCQTP